MVEKMKKIASINFNDIPGYNNHVIVDENKFLFYHDKISDIEELISITERKFAIKLKVDCGPINSKKYNSYVTEIHV